VFRYIFWVLRGISGRISDKVLLGVAYNQFLLVLGKYEFSSYPVFTDEYVLRVQIGMMIMHLIANMFGYDFWGSERFGY